MDLTLFQDDVRAQQG